MAAIHTDQFVADAVALVLEEARNAIARRGRFILSLCGGNTPKPVYAALAEAGADWEKWHITFGDERCVPPDHEQSNYRMVNTAWFAKVPIPEVNIFRMKGELPPEEGALDYEKRLVALTEGNLPPVHDLTFLGMGDDGHTASLFPGTPALEVRDRWCVPNHVEKLDSWRLTLTFPVLDASRRVVFLVNGASKRPMYETVQADRSAYPSGCIEPVDGKLDWLLGFV